MAPIKFEEKLKDKLEKRSLTPSPEAWAKLADRLEDDKDKSKNPIYWWFSIAAGLIIMIAVSTQIFKANEDEQLEQHLVEESVDEESIAPVSKASKDLNRIELVNDVKQLENKTKKPQVLKYGKVIKDAHKAESQLAEKITEHTKPDFSDLSNNLNDELIMTTDAGLTDSTIAEAPKTLVTDAEIDVLLQLASQELLKDRLIKDTKRTVDANALLESVQEDMGTSFRSRVFEALKDSYETVKTAVVQRNN